MRFSTYAEALAWLESRVDFERETPHRHRPPTLEPVSSTLALLADPHRDYPSVHVTGTNGKGTTTTLASALLRAAGLRVGTYTSPDLHAVNERIAINGEPIDDDTFVELFSRVADVESVSGITLTRFEALTVAALLHFSDEGVDVAVVEVGLGGTWDATNVIDSDVAVLTNVDLDHTAVLGPTVGAIARDKVGIFREDGIAIVGTSDDEVVEIARERAERLGATLWLSGRDVIVERNDLAVGGRRLSVRTPYARHDDVLLSLHGVHQGRNAAVAIAAAEAFLGRRLDDDLVTRVLGSIRMPGRLEVVGHDPMVVIDGAHNPAGLRALVASLADGFHVAGERRCVMGVLEGRDIGDMLDPLVEAGVTWFYVAAPRSPRAVDPEILAAAARERGVGASVHPSGAAALAHARENARDDDLVIVTGSLYLVGEVRAELLGIAHRHAS